MSKQRICPICNNTSVPVFKKENTDYYICANCTMIWCDDLSQEGLIGGSFEKERNEKQNHLRIERVNEMAKGLTKEQVRILDFGASRGMLIKDLKDADYPNVDGYDAYAEQYQRIPEPNTYHIIICVETAEHFSAPYIEFDLMNRLLVTGGVVCVETGFLDATRADGIPDDENPYINPVAGHSTIYTHHSLDVLMLTKKFAIKPFFNRHCLLYQKL